MSHQVVATQRLLGPFSTSTRLSVDYFLIPKRQQCFCVLNGFFLINLPMEPNKDFDFSNRRELGLTFFSWVKSLVWIHVCCIMHWVCRYGVSSSSTKSKVSHEKQLLFSIILVG